MGEEIAVFGDTEIEKDKSHLLKVLLFFEDVGNGNVLASNKISSGEKKL